MVTLRPPQFDGIFDLIEVRLDGAGLVEGYVHVSIVLDEVNGSDGPVVDVEVGDHLEVGNSSKSRVSIPQAPEVGFVKTSMSWDLRERSEFST